MRDLLGVAVGVYDGADLFKHFGTFSLKKFSEICTKTEVGLYRDGSLSIFRNESDTQLEKIKKKLQRLFKECDLEITAESDQKFVNYLTSPQTLTIKI